MIFFEYEADWNDGELSDCEASSLERAQKYALQEFEMRLEDDPERSNEGCVTFIKYELDDDGERAVLDRIYDFFVHGKPFDDIDLYA